MFEVADSAYDNFLPFVLRKTPHKDISPAFQKIRVRELSHEISPGLAVSGDESKKLPTWPS